MGGVHGLGPRGVRPESGPERSCCAASDFLFL